MPRIIPIVESDGDMEAVPLLIRRTLHQNELWHREVGTPKKARNMAVFGQRAADFLRYARREKDCAAILVVLDLDDGCPAHVARQLADQVRGLHTDVPVAIVLAHREYES
ncbi:MAG: hypothetical protein M5U01_05525 [Ardenticatenaceae bacterium]|nr:hypothetical protein [Ardenticatenaceae bacterium]HBY98422.1 hypothetical protein [Chloroflexota bacterium]